MCQVICQLTGPVPTFIEHPVTAVIAAFRWRPLPWDDNRVFCMPFRSFSAYNGLANRCIRNKLNCVVVGCVGMCAASGLAFSQGNRPSARANRVRAFLRGTEQPSRLGQARPDAGSPCTKRSTGRGRRQHCRASSAGRARTSPMLERAEDDRLRGLVLHKEEAVECHNTGHVECLAKRNEVHAVPSLLRHRVPISELLFQYILLAS